MAEAHPTSIPVTLIGGFLGAGKTTLLNHVLSENHGVRAAVLVNDFGAINIDAKLVVGVDGDTVQLANGCVCCTIRGDLVGACLGLLQRPEPPQHLFVELSGVSDPVPVLNTFLETDLASVFRLNSILSIVDAEQFPNMKGEMARLARVQLGAADLVVFNKVDLVSRRELDRVKDLVQQLTPGARTIEALRGRVPLELVFMGVEGDLRTRRLEADEGGRHAHPHGHGLEAWSWAADRPLSLPTLRAALEVLPETIYRCKGILYLEELPVFRYVLQMVGRRYHIEETGGWGEVEPRSEIVLIGNLNGIHESELQHAFDACIGAGDEARSPILRLARKLAPELSDDHHPDAMDSRDPIRTH